jgi:hypothetical protein
VHESPLQHAALTPHDPPAAAQLTVFGTHCPDTQRPEQQEPDDAQASPSSMQPTTPSPQVPLVHRPLQHDAAPLHAAPSAEQLPLAHRPLVQLRPAQQPPNAPPQIWPLPAQLGAISVHCPPRQLPEQHWLCAVHAAPGNEQLRKSSHTSFELQIDGKQHSPLSMQASPSPVHRPDPIASTHSSRPPLGKQIRPGQQPDPSTAESKQPSWYVWHWPTSHRPSMQLRPKLQSE